LVKLRGQSRFKHFMFWWRRKLW